MIFPVSVVCDLGSWLDTHMSMNMLAKFAARDLEAFTILNKSGNT